MTMSIAKGIRMINYKARFVFAALFAFAQSGNAQTAPHATFYQEAFETAAGIDGSIHVVTAQGKLTPNIYTADDYGSITVYDTVTGQPTMFGQVYPNGTKVMVAASKPKPPKPSGRFVKPGGWATAACFVGESVAAARCEALCRTTGIAEFTGGYCGFGATCKCHAPPPPPPVTTPGTVFTFIPPWVTIANWERSPVNPGWNDPQ